MQPLLSLDNVVICHITGVMDEQHTHLSRLWYTWCRITIRTGYHQDICGVSRLLNKQRCSLCRDVRTSAGLFFFGRGRPGRGLLFLLLLLLF